jgi:ribosomal protein L44E
LVKEEKILLLAVESADQQQIIGAMVDTIKHCVFDKVDVNKLPLFDVEYMFAQIRAKSVGETTTLRFKCNECSTINEAVVDISSIEMKVPKGTSEFELVPGVSVVMAWPNCRDTASITPDGDKVESAFELVQKCIVKVKTEDESVDYQEESEEERETFLNALPGSALQKMIEFIQSMPTLQHDIVFDCGSCGAKNEHKLEGLADFF